MGSTWVDEEAASNMRPCQNIDPTKLKITNDPGNFFSIFVDFRGILPLKSIW